MTEIKTNTNPVLHMYWHEIAHDTHAMNTATGAIVRVCLQETEYDSGKCEGLAVSITHVPGLTVAHRWVVTDVESHQDEDGDQIDTHEQWQAEISLVEDNAVDRDSNAKRVAELRQDRAEASNTPHHPQPLEDRLRIIDEVIRDRLTRWHDADDPLPDPTGQG